MDLFQGHLLSVITFTPLVGALLLLLPPFKQNEKAVKWFANGVGLLGFLVSLPLWFSFDVSHPTPFQFVEKAEWIPTIGVSYHMGVDGISALLILLTTMLGSIAILSSWNAVHMRVRAYYVFLLLLQTGMIGVFCALDMFLFYVFWEVMLVPMYFLIGIWGAENRLYAAIKFFLYTLVGSVVMLLGSWRCTSSRASCPSSRRRGRSTSRAGTRWASRRTCSTGASWPSSWASRSRCRCSRSTPGCPTPTCRRPRPAR
jgi:NADH-quinone oxidoreductase subunit M